MTLRFAFGSFRPSAIASFQPPAYHTQLTPFAESVSPIVFSLSGGTGWCAVSARSRLAPAAGGMPLGWYGGCEVFTMYTSGVTNPSQNTTSTTINMACELGV